MNNDSKANLVMRALKWRHATASVEDVRRKKAGRMEASRAGLFLMGFEDKEGGKN